MFEHLDDPFPFTPDEPLRAAVERSGAQRRRRRRGLTAAACSALTLVLVAGSVAAFARTRVEGIQRVDIGPGAAPGGVLDRPFTALVVGVDDGDRTDTILLVRVDPEARTVRGATIPRDLQVAIPGHGEDRINTARAHGRGVLVDTVRQSLGVPVDHYAEVGFEALRQLVDALGGVPIRFPVPARDLHSGLYVDEPGCRTLSGTEALALARARHLELRAGNGVWLADGASDFSRMTSAAVLVEALVGRAGARAGGPGGLAALATLATDQVVLDDHLGAGDLVALAERLRGLPGRDIAWLFPAVRELQRTDRAQVLVLDQPADRYRVFLETGTVPGQPAPGPVDRPLPLRGPMPDGCS